MLLSRGMWNGIEYAWTAKLTSMQIMLWYTVQREMFEGLNFRGFHGYSNPTRKLSPYKLNYLL